MKFHHSLIAAIVIPLLSSPLHAANDAAREFDQLTLERDKALAAAADPINRRYQAALEALLQRASVANDSATVLRITQALGKPPVISVPGANGIKADVIGSWKFYNHADKHLAVIEINTDKTYSAGGKRIASWEIIDNQIVITYDANPGNQDRYNLPPRDGRLEGKNRGGQPLTLTRVSQ